MKKIIGIFLTVVLCIVFFAVMISACNSCAPSDSTLIEEMAEKIIFALDHKDATALKSLFTGHVKAENENLDRGVEHVMQQYTGTSISVTGGGGYSGGGANALNVSKEVFCNYTVKTEEGMYRLAFYVRWSSYDKDDIGLFQLRVLTEKDNSLARASFYLLHDRTTAGILWDGMLTPDDYIAGFMHTLSDKSHPAESLLALFAKETRETVSNFAERITEVQSVFSNNLITLQSAHESAITYQSLPNAVVFSERQSETQIFLKATREVPTVKDNRALSEKDEVGIEYRRFLVYMVYCVDSIDRSNDGICTIQIVEKTDKNRDYLIDDTAGIFIYTDAAESLTGE